MKYKRLLITILLIALLVPIALRVYNYFTFAKGEFNILILYNPALLESCSYVIHAYESVLQEEGIPFKKLDYSMLPPRIEKDFVLKHPALILPDCALQHMNPDLKTWYETYLSKGGSLLLVYDAGIKDHKGAYLKEPIFSYLLDINYSTYHKLREKSYTIAHIKILYPKLLGITPGKLDKDLRFVKGYKYGNLEYPVAKAEILKPTMQILATAQTREGEELPALAIKDYKKGKIFYANLPLGHLKAYSEDLWLRSVIRYFLFKTLRIPHIYNTPYGIGGLVINWHIDANSDWKSIPFMIENGYFVEGIEYSNHITAGDFRDTPGDNLGFDACGKGKDFVKMILPYGLIGSHGGWAHNWFSYGILEGKINKEDMEKYIRMNNECLESITGYKIREYSAPNGVHPPEKTEILERMGFVAYYYTGDSGSSPNRTFLNGKMISSKVIAFPITHLREHASLYEMWREGISEEEVESFLLDLLNFVEREKVIRLFYSHPYDIPHYPRAIKSFLDKANDLQKQGKIQIKPMSYFADFLLRFLRTKYSFKLNGNLLEVNLVNPEGLSGITVAIPKSYRLIEDYKNTIIKQDENYYYIIIKDDIKSATFTFEFNP